MDMATHRNFQELDAKERLLRILLDHTLDGIEVIDPATLRFIEVNQSECRALGYSREELLEMTVLDIDPAFDADRQHDIVAQVNQMANARFESIHRRKDGSEFPVEINATLVQLDKPYVIAIVRDITERKKTEDEIFRNSRILWMLSEGNRLLLRANDENLLMQHMCHLITTTGGYPLAWIGFALSNEEKDIGPIAISGDSKEYVNEISLSWGDVPSGRGPAGEAIRSGKTQVVHDTQGDTRLLPWRDLVRHHGYNSIISLPLNDGKTVFGVLNIYATSTAAFTTNEVKLLEELAEDLAFGVSSLRTRHERDHAVNEHQKYVEKLRASMEDAIQTISTVIEMRDPYTAGHQRRVADLAAAIGHELGLPDDQVHGVHLAATIHDLGKIRVPSEILTKPGHLSALEMGLVKEHPQTGQEILAGIEFPWPIATTVLQHHERWDGSGYPQGLEGDEILLEARILAVADVVESMASHRPYRPGLGVEAALEDIRANAGVLYDPAIATVCLSLFLEKGYEFPAH